MQADSFQHARTRKTFVIINIFSFINRQKYIKKVVIIKKLSFIGLLEVLSTIHLVVYITSREQDAQLRGQGEHIT